MIKLNQLKYFVSSVESGSLTTAAKTLFISQPALSKQLVQLEHDIGCKLFHRKTTGVELTKAGSFFYDRSSAIIAEIEQLTFDMKKYSKRDTIKIGTLTSIGSILLPQLITKINSDYKLELIIKNTTAELVEMVEKDRVDFAFVQDAEENKNILVEKLLYEPYDAILPINSYLSNLNEFYLADLLQESIILHKSPCDIRSFFDSYCKRRGIEYSISMELDFEFNSILPFIKSGVGPTFLPRMVSSQIIDPEIIVKHLLDDNFGRSINFLYKPTFKKIASEFLVHLKEIINDLTSGYTKTLSEPLKK